MSDLLPIDSIKVGDRDRADLGNIVELADSIAAVGLLHPVVVTHGGDLVAGDRRLAAVRHLGWTEVPVTVATVETLAHLLQAEADENACRKPLTPYEASRARERRAALLAPQAAERKGGRPAKSETSANLAEVSRPATSARFLASAIQAQRPWARDTEREATRIGLARLIDRVVRRGRVLVSYSGEVVAKPKVIGIRRKAEDGVEIDVQALIYAVTWEELERKRVDYLRQMKAYGENVGLIDKLLALKEMSPGAASPQEAASALGIDIESYLLDAAA